MDLDDDELKATRELNGSNKNVGSMEEDINKLIEELTNVRPDELSTEGLKLFNKINEIINKNKELEEENKIILNSKVGVDLSFDDYIQVSLVEENIAELNKKEKQELKGLKGQDRYFVKQMYQYKRSVLQELLEKRK